VELFIFMLARSSTAFCLETVAHNWWWVCVVTERIDKTDGAEGPRKGCLEQCQ